MAAEEKGHVSNFMNHVYQYDKPANLQLKVFCLPFSTLLVFLWKKLVAMLHWHLRGTFYSLFLSIVASKI